MNLEPVDEPTAAFTPTWDPVWDDEPRRPDPARPSALAPNPPLSALLPVAARPAPEQKDERAVPRTEPQRIEKGRGRARIARQAPQHRQGFGPHLAVVLARFRALISLIVVVVFSGVALAAAIGLAALAVGLALRQVAGA